MTTSTTTKLSILRANPHVIAVYDQPNPAGNRLHILVDNTTRTQAVKLPKVLRDKSVTVHATRPFKTLTLPVAQANTDCYNEPVPGGVQVQPAGLPWVGTFGAPCSYRNQDGERRWGILSNWHVLCSGEASKGHPIHQPIDHYPALAALDQYLAVSPDQTNTFDAALADAKLYGLHTIHTQILDTGDFSPEIAQPRTGMKVRKTGRTTRLTQADCTAVGACVRVSYGHFTADFCGQAIFASDQKSFSAPGDSGSLILENDSFKPTALLFAGNDELTVGSPLAPIVTQFSLSFNFTE